MKVLVTGATGFLGAHLVRALLAQGDEITALCRNEEPELEEKGVTVQRGDILDPASVAAAARGAEGVYHAAGKVSRKREDAEALYKVHVDGTRNVLSAAREVGARRVVVASTSGTVAVSDDPTRIATEESETPVAILARWPYYRAKLYAEKVALESNAPGLDVICVNPTLLLGPGDLHDSSTEDVRLFLEKLIPAIPSGGISFVDARDAAEAMRLAMTHGTPGARYLVGACNMTLAEFFARLSRVSGIGAPWMRMPRSKELAKLGARLLEGSMARFLGVGSRVDPVSLEMSQYYWYLDASRAERELGWSPRDPMVTLADTVRDLRARGAVWPALGAGASSASP